MHVLLHFKIDALVIHYIIETNHSIENGSICTVFWQVAQYLYKFDCGGERSITQSC